MKYFSKIYIAIFLTVLSGILYVFFSIGEVREQLKSHLDTMFINEAGMFARNVSEELHRHLQKTSYTSLYNALQNDPELRETLEDDLSMLVTEHYRFVYVLYRDTQGVYRYLLDGSHDEKGEFNQRFNVDDTYWNRVYETKKAVVINQQKLDGLWITYLEPVVFDNKVQGVVAIDFSVSLLHSIDETIDPLNRSFIYIFTAIGLMVLVLLYQTVLNIKTKKESYLDALTGVYNRNYLRVFIEKINLNQYQIMMLDIDHFKRVNDNYGHKAGDVVLYNIAKILKKTLRENDVVVRFGGEEFLVFVKRDKGGNETAFKIANRIKEAIAHYSFNIGKEHLHVSVSIGINCFPHHFKNVNEAIKFADEMLYIAKRTGRNKVVSTHEKGSYLISEDISINDVKEALDEERVMCFYQAIYSTTKEAKTVVSKYEALVRMRDKEGKVLLPYKFLPKIANTNVYNDLTKRVLEIVFEKIEQKRVHVSMNLNISDILNNDIYETIEQGLKAHRELSKWLVIEILENEYIEDVEIVQQRVELMKSYGVEIAIDDFGSGYSNYQVLQLLPVDYIKIDGSIIKDADTSETAHKIVKSIVGLARELGMQTIAEFVHSKEVLEELQEIGVDYFQGFYLSEPKESI